MAGKRAAGPKPSRPAKKITNLLPKGYEELLAQLKERIRSAQLRAGLAVNCEMVLLYWHIGRDILTRQEHEGWGARVIDRLAADLRRAYPEMTGLSPRNLKYMRAFAQAWPDEAIVQAPLAQITSAVDDLLRHPDDQPSIGIILCKTKNQVVAEYALRDLAKPVGISSYVIKLVESLPPTLRGSLPSPKELEAELNRGESPEEG
jgi:hypothetical protein